MNLKIPLVLFIFFLVLNPNLVSSKNDSPYPLVSKCRQKIRDPLYLGLIDHADHCYYMIKGSTNRTNKPMGNGMFEFDIEAARVVCKNEGSMLPIIKTKEENEVVGKHFRKIDGEFRGDQFALGLVQERQSLDFSYSWDDGNRMTFIPATWSGKNEEAVYTVMEYGIGWKNIPEETQLKSPIGVVCQEPVGEELVCDRKESALEKKRSPFVVTRIFNNRSCYFVIKGATERANVGDKFDIDVAREECRKYRATLPVVESLEEDSFIASFSESEPALGKFKNHGTSEFSVPLGLTLKTKKEPDGYITEWNFEWDDGQPLMYQGEWFNKYEKEEAEHIFATENSYRGKKGPFTKEWRSKKPKDHVAVVMCEQPYRSRPSALSTSTPAVKQISHCDRGQNERIQSSKSYQGIWCYFIINNATRETNWPVVIGGRKPFIFDVWKARDICKSQDGYLPVIDGEDEYKFIMENFKGKQFEAPNVDGKMEHAVYIALGLRPGVKQMDYVLDDGSALKYSPSEWIKDASMLFTMMSLYNMSWIDLDERRVSPPVGVLCKQPRYEEYIPTTTESDEEPTTISYPEPKHLKGPCSLANEGKFKKTRQFGDRVCYFIVRQANKANLNMEFNLNNARQSCTKHGGHLPIIRNDEEFQFIKRSFDLEKDFESEDIVFGPPQGIALGINANTVRVPEMAIACARDPETSCLQKVKMQWNDGKEDERWAYVQPATDDELENVENPNNPQVRHMYLKKNHRGELDYAITWGKIEDIAVLCQLNLDVDTTGTPPFGKNPSTQNPGDGGAMVRGSYIWAIPVLTRLAISG